MLVGAEFHMPPAIFSIAPNGEILTNFVDTLPEDPDIVPQSRTLFCQPEDFDIIPPNQDFYVLDQHDNRILKLSRNLLTNFVGDLMVVQEGFIDDSQNLVPRDHPAKLMVMHWTGTNFITRMSISRRHNDWWEHGTFAPMNIPAVTP